MELRDCPLCGPEAWFEQLECADGHDDACPDRVCTECGTVLLEGLEPLEGLVPLAVGLPSGGLFAVGT